MRDVTPCLPGPCTEPRPDATPQGRHPVDIHVGRRLRQRRWALGVTLEEVASRLGVKPQQVQKYETGRNRMSASRLWAVARAVDVPVSYFFEGLKGKAEHAGPARGDLLVDREAMDLVRAYYALPAEPRRRLLALALALGDAA
jgi:transcriptional regulator with XRE-family HTH domain